MKLIAPTMEDIRGDGYPLNQSGESYGGDVYENINMGPDLILVENTEGIVGYVKESDFDHFSPTTPEEAAAYQPKDYNLVMPPQAAPC